MTGVFSTFYLITHAGTVKKKPCLIGQTLIAAALHVIEKYLKLMLVLRVLILALRRNADKISA